ncbi:hypothetical protein [Paenibacillus sp. FSL K6-1318]|uniref:hypothetical protein n=2 Tax=unclassified Paenibacillus TaxID=185978 RepID=UPI0030EE4FA8
MGLEFNPYPKSKQTKSKRVKPTQRQMGDIRDSVDKQLKERSQGICEACEKARATQRAHLTGRKQIDHRTEVYDLAHLCDECHDLLDETEAGIRFRRLAATIISAALK